MFRRFLLLWILVGVLIVYGVGGAFYLRRYRFNLSALMVVGKRFYNPALFPSNTFVYKGSSGYDGQFYYYIALDPLIRKDIYKEIDSPAYRYQRIIYPLLTCVLSLGRKELFPLVFLLLNMISVLGGTYFLSKIAEIYGVKHWQWYGLFYAFSLGIIFSVIRDLAEPVVFFFLVAGVYYYLKDRVYLSALFLSLSVLGRESLLLFVLSIVLVEFLCIDRKRFFRALLLCIPVFVFGGWFFYVFYKLGLFPPAEGGKIIDIPFFSFYYLAKNIIFSPRGYWHKLMWFSSFLFLAISFFLSVKYLYRRLDFVSLSLLFSLVLSVSLGSNVWVDFWGYERILLIVYFPLLLSYFSMKEKLSIASATLVTPVPLFLGGIVRVLMGR